MTLKTVLSQATSELTVQVLLNHHRYILTLFVPCHLSNSAERSVLKSILPDQYDFIVHSLIPHVRNQAMLMQVVSAQAFEMSRQISHLLPA